MQFYAHSTDNPDKSDWQKLEEHLQGVAELAEEFAAVFGAGEWGKLSGVHHDLGKGTLPWQAYLRYANKIVDEFAKFYTGHPSHAVVGAQWLFKHSDQAGKLLAYCIAGHHGGLPNWSDTSSAALEAKLQEDLPDIQFPLADPYFPQSFPVAKPETERLGFQLQFFVRMLFSCLVDADFLDTEKSLDKKKSNRRSNYPSIDELHQYFWNNFKKLRKKADKIENENQRRVNRQREQVLDDCLHASEQESGLFSLTVPTGGSKTLSSLAFALNHALLKKSPKRRIIYVVPFTSIIEQNAKVFREMLGDNAVLEHHCNYIPDETDWQTRLASENWDAPVIVTTNVQFFNSFYANKPSKCRKLHNVANSIIIFDEVQAIPVDKLQPCLEVIKELSLNYGVTSVLCTATQPAIKYSDQFKSGLENVREIIHDVPRLFKELKRTEEVYVGELSEQLVAEKMMENKQVLCIVNSRQQALDIFQELPDADENFHLSALMHPAHRTEKLAEIRSRLDNGKTCRVVSTQLIEAGVDVDFPCVYRAVAGIDSIAQAAGRCNRNGRSKDQLNVYVFDFPEGVGCSYFRLTAQSAEKLLIPFAGKLTDPQCVQEYFADYYWKNSQRLDEAGIIECCRTAQSGNIQFKDLARFQMIESATVPIVIALEKVASDLVESLRFAEYRGGILRQLQQFTVQVYPYQFDDLKGWCESPLAGVYVLRSDELYSEDTGLKCKAPEGAAFFG
ncbi:MAG: CRISPR-associated helicase Cas3' [Desulfuromonadales bacterium]|nr:CRISPR-associated helicase Cas3' [Desulfuromonadales bacterium]MBN2791683.1 CRISPR-associated helicase Cas3' [Desulfuromonadales bacterium]